MPSGRRPTARSVSTSATCTAAMDTKELVTSSKAESGASVSTCSRSSPCGRSAAAARRSVAAHAGTRSSARPMPAHCEPMPENTNQTGRRSPLSTSCRHPTHTYAR